MASQDPIQFMIRALRKATRPALERTFRYWLANHAPDHFERTAFVKYPKAYSESAKLDMNTWLSRRQSQIKHWMVDPKARPVVRRRVFRNRFLGGAVIYTGGPTSLRVHWANLPPYASYTNKYSGFQPSSAVTYVTPDEEQELAEVFMAHQIGLATSAKYLGTTGCIPLRTHGFMPVKA